MFEANFSGEKKIKPDINILLVVFRCSELHDVLDEVESLDVHVVSIDFVPHHLSSTATHTEHHDGLHR